MVAGNVADARQLYETACKMFEARGIPDMVQVRALQAWGTLEGKEGGLPQLARRLFEKSLECAKQVQPPPDHSATWSPRTRCSFWRAMLCELFLDLGAASQLPSIPLSQDLSTVS